MTPTSTSDCPVCGHNSQRPAPAVCFKKSYHLSRYRAGVADAISGQRNFGHQTQQLFKETDAVLASQAIGDLWREAFKAGVEGGANEATRILIDIANELGDPVLIIAVADAVKRRIEAKRTPSQPP